MRALVLGFIQYMIYMLRFLKIGAKLGGSGTCSLITCVHVLLVYIYSDLDELSDSMNISGT